MEKASSSNNTDLENNKTSVVEALREMFVEYEQVQDDVLDNHLQKWKKEQRENGYGDESGLTSIQTLCEDLAENILLLKRKLEQFNLDSTNQQEFQLQILAFLQYLVSSTFMIVKQPPQVQLPHPRH